MARVLRYGWILAGLVVFPVLGWACEPCAEEWDLEQTAAQADVVVVAQKIADGPDSNFGQQPGGPEWIDVRVLRVLKGSVAAESVLRVNSWDAMCDDYGIVVDERPYVMLLMKPDPVHGHSYYNAVNYGCAQKVYEVSGDAVKVGDATVSLSDFMAHLDQASRR